MKNNKIEAVFFDLFFTLIVPAYSSGRNEYAVLDISVDEWEKYASWCEPGTVKKLYKENGMVEDIEWLFLTNMCIDYQEIIEAIM